VRGAFAFGRGLNIRENNTLKCNQALKKDSSTTVTDLVLAMFKASDGKTYAFGDTGKIYRKSSGTWALVHTDSDGKITGACEFKSTSNSFILYATQTKLKKITLANAGATWAANVVEVGTFTNGIAGDFHTMRVAIGVVIVNDGDVLAMYDYADAFAATALRMSTGTKGKCLLDRNNRVIVGGKENDDGKFITWKRTDDSWEDKKSAQGSEVNAMGFLEAGILAQVGGAGKLKYWNFCETVPLTTIPGTGSAYPGAVAEYGTITHIGMNGGTKNGVYSLGRLDLNDPRALNLEYIPSHGKLTGTEIGALCNDGTDLLVSWKDGTTYGIDIIDNSNKAVAVYESLKLNMGKSNMDKLYRMVKLLLAEPLPAGCTVGLKYRATKVTTEEAAADDADGWVPTTMSDDRSTINGTGETKGIFNLEGQGEKVELQITLTPSGNTGPEVDSAHVGFTFDNGI
jgi:hypothetical protein